MQKKGERESQLVKHVKQIKNKENDAKETRTDTKENVYVVSTCVFVEVTRPREEA